MKCTKAPHGWYCTRTAEHSGPCAAEQTVEGLIVNNCFDSDGNLLINVPESEWSDLKQMEMDYVKLNGLVWEAKEELLKREQDPEFHCESAYRLLLKGLNL